MNRQFASLHIGAEEITAVAAHWTRGGDYVIEGFYRTGAKGLREGIVTDATTAVDSMMKGLNGIKEKTGSRFREVYTGITSPSVEVVPASGDILLSKYGREVTSRDVKRCVDAGSIIRLPLDREPLHRLVSEFAVDGEKNIKNPVNLEAVKLGVKINVITINSNVLRNVAKCINMAGYLSSGFVFSGLASSYRVITKEEKNEGVALLRICRGITEIVFFNEGVMAGCKVISAGADDIGTSDGGVDKGAFDALVSAVVSSPHRNGIKKLVVTGEGSMLDSMLESLENSFSLPVRAGNCITKPFENLPEDRMGYIVNLGVMDHLQQENLRDRVAGSLIKSSAHRVVEFIDRYF